MSALIWRLVLVWVITAATQVPHNAFAQTSRTLELVDQTTTATDVPKAELLPQAEAAFKKGNFEYAVMLYELYLEDNPDDNDQRIQLARALIADGNQEKALELIEQVLSRVPESTDALLIRGNIRLWEKNYSLARLDFKKVIKEAPGYCDAHISLAKSYLWEDKPADARTVLNSVPHQCKDEEAYRVILAQVEAERNDSSKALNTKVASVNSARFDPTPSASVDDFDKLVKNARELIRLDDKPGAEQVVDYILSRNASYADALLLKGLLSLWRNCPAEAEYWFRRTLAIAPEHCEAYYGLSNVQIQFKNFENARHVLTTRRECACTAEGIAQLGRVENADGNYALAKDLFTQALSMEPTNHDFHEALDNVDLYTNTTTVHVESFRQTGTQWSINNTLTFRPCKEVMWIAVLEHFHRFGHSDQRAGGGVTWHPQDDIWLSAQALFARHEEVVPSRYETDLTYRLLDCPGTYVRAGVIYYHATETSAWTRYLGVRQTLSQYWHLEYRRLWSDTLSPSREHAHADDINVRYEKEEERIVTLGLTRGNEVFSESASNFSSASGSYAVESIYAAWKEWMHDDWGVQLSASQSVRSNNNDSRAFSVGVFFEF